MTILGISAYYHDSAAAIIRDGRVIAAAQEERFSRIKNDKNFPAAAVRYCLQEAGARIDELDAVAYYEKPFLKFERLLESYYAFAPMGFSSFLKSMPSWIKEKIFIKKNLRNELAAIQAFDARKLKLIFPEHHLSHAASAYYPSGFSEAAILTIDGVGEFATTTICRGTGNKIEILKEQHFPHSLGLLYSAFTYFLGFQVNSDEYKLMGLAPYGNPGSAGTHKFHKLIIDHLVTIFDDGSIHMNQSYFDYAAGLKMVNEKKFNELFGFSRRLPGAEFATHHLDCALAIQQVTETIVTRLAAHARQLTNSKNLCLAGGVALNCVANGKIQKALQYEQLFIQPAAGDAGGALGAALAGHHIFFDKPLTQIPGGSDGMKGSCLGPQFGNQQIEQMAKLAGASYKKYNNSKELCADTAQLISKGNVVGWFQGRMEFGPRALGNRSILADPRHPEMQKRLNLKIKFREGFRPFAPAVIAADCPDYFDLNGPSPYMLIVQKLKDSQLLPLPARYLSFSWQEKLHSVKSLLPAITHVDLTARIQTVSQENNPLFFELLQTYKQLTGYGVLINTSMNVRDEPIACTPEDAYNTFIKTEMDYLVAGNFLFNKGEQV